MLGTPGYAEPVAVVGIEAVETPACDEGDVGPDAAEDPPWRALEMLAATEDATPDEAEYPTGTVIAFPLE